MAWLTPDMQLGIAVVVVMLVARGVKRVVRRWLL
jgi:hypothetical protein